VFHSIHEHKRICSSIHSFIIFWVNNPRISLICGGLVIAFIVWVLWLYVTCNYVIILITGHKLQANHPIKIGEAIPATSQPISPPQNTPFRQSSSLNILSKAKSISRDCFSAFLIALAIALSWCSSASLAFCDIASTILSFVVPRTAFRFWLNCWFWVCMALRNSLFSACITLTCSIIAKWLASTAR